MLRNLKDLFGYSVVTSDRPGDRVGKVDDVYFDDESWHARYVVVDTGGWLASNRVLIAPEAFAGAPWEQHLAPVTMTRDQIERAPNIDADKPVSRQQEADLHDYFGWSPYWGIGTPYASIYPSPEEVEMAREEVEAEEREREYAGDLDAELYRGDPHLRSAQEVIGYQIHATDGQIGHVEDFVVDTDAWMLRYLVVDPRNWLPGKNVLVSVSWVRGVDFPLNEVRVDLPRERIKDAPPYDHSRPLDRSYEARLFAYYDRPPYWERPGRRVG